MKRTFLNVVIILLASIYGIEGQDYTAGGHQYTFHKANKLFEDYSFQDALDLYQQLLTVDFAEPSLKLQMAECYRYLNNPDRAVFFYAQVFKNEESNKPIHKFHYADALFKLGRFEKAREWLQNYKQEVPEDERVEKILLAITNYASFYHDSAFYATKHLGFNTPESDFGPSYFESGIVFASARRDFGTFAKGKYKRDNTMFLDLYYAPLEADCTITDVLKFSPSLNSKYHESSPVFYDNGNKVLFTRNNYHAKKLSKSSVGEVNLKLFAAETDEYGYWYNIQELPFNSDEYSVGHATLSSDAEIIYFVSDKPGGLGETDIYRSQKVNGVWEEPQNLGNSVNTKGREMFPFIHKDQWLYFASDGHLGMGGLDIYRLNLSTNEMVNLGYPINTAWDDFALIKNPQGNQGFFSSNRQGGMGNDDIYAFYQLSLNLQVTVVDELNDHLLEGAQVTILENDIVVQEVFTDPRGEIASTIFPAKQYQIQVVKEGYVTVKKELSTVENKPGEIVQLRLPLSSFITLHGQVYDAASMNLLPQAKVSIVNESTGEEQEFQSDSQGKFQVKLPHNQRFSLVGQHGTKTAMIVGYKPGNTKEDSIELLLEDKILKLEDVQMEAIDDKAKTTLLGNGVRITGPIEIENIYYEFDRWEIGTLAALALDKIVQVMNENSELKIELSSHTDARGTESYNETLSKKRARSAVAYMESRGIDRKRLTYKGYGESKLLNECQDESDCSEEEHQRNRRTEFTVLEF